MSSFSHANKTKTNKNKKSKMIPTALKRLLYALIAVHLTAKVQSYLAQKRREASALKRRANPKTP